MSRRKTNAEFKKEVYDLVGDEYTFLDHYVNTDTKLKVKHNNCGNTYKVTPHNFIGGKRCPYCCSNANKTNAEFKKEVFDLVGNEYTFLEPYADALTKIGVKHIKCEHIYKVTPNSFLQGSRCPYCAKSIRGDKLVKTDDEFKQEVHELVGDEYTFLDTYVNNVTKLKVKHNTCGNIYEVTPSSFLGGSHCPHCNAGGVSKKTNVEFRHEVFSLVGNEYSFLETYQGTGNKLKVKHSKCGHTYKVRPTDFLDHHARCPYCSSPKGEDIINKILNNLNIHFEYQKTFDDLKDTNLLSYDFFIPNQNILIEYQGIQHYKPIDYFGGDERFNYQQKHDQMKADYAKANGYNLIAVPYTEDTFSKIKKYLIKHGLR